MEGRETYGVVIVVSMNGIASLPAELDHLYSADGAPAALSCPC
jgi:hypothetical protein